MIISFDIPNAIVTELGAYATRHGFVSARQMLVSQIKEAIKHERLDKLREAAPKESEVSTDDVVIG